MEIARIPTLMDCSRLEQFQPSESTTTPPHAIARLVPIFKALAAGDGFAALCQLRKALNDIDLSVMSPDLEDSTLASLYIVTRLVRDTWANAGCDSTSDFPVDGPAGIAMNRLCEHLGQIAPRANSDSSWAHGNHSHLLDAIRAYFDMIKSIDEHGKLPTGMEAEI